MKVNAFSEFETPGGSRGWHVGMGIEEMNTLKLNGSVHRSYNNGVSLIAGGSYVKVSNNSLELKNGIVWVTSQKGNNFSVISSVNSIAKYTQGHFIYSFGQLSAPLIYQN